MDYRNILVIQTAFLGDVILTSPLLRALTLVFPESRIDLLTIPETGGVFKYHPNVHQVLYFNKRKSWAKLFSFVNLLFRLRRTGYDLAFSIQSSLTSSFMMILGGIPQRVGFWRQKLITTPITPPQRGMHMRDRYLSMLQPFATNAFDNQTEIIWSNSEEKTGQEIVDQIPKDRQHRIGVAPGSVWNTKKWPPEYYAALLGLLASEKVQLFLIGGPGDRALCQWIQQESQTDAINLAGELSVLESAALIARLDLMITNDSAPLHIANAVKTDVCAFFGPTVRRFGCYPFRENDRLLEIDLYCRPCSKHGGRKCPEKHFRCMREISPETAFDVIKSQLKGVNHGNK